jgi:translation initiation factor IF-2
MDIVRTGEARRFSRQRPTHVSLFDRPRLVGDLLCLEPDQRDEPRTYPASDAVYFVLEGHAQIDLGSHSQDLGPEDTVVVPPGIAHRIANPGPGRLTLLAIVGPKPTRAGEVRLPRPSRPSARPRPARQETGEWQPPPEETSGREERPRPTRPAGLRPARPAGQRPGGFSRPAGRPGGGGSGRSGTGRPQRPAGSVGRPRSPGAGLGRPRPAGDTGTGPRWPRPAGGAGTRPASPRRPGARPGPPRPGGGPGRGAPRPPSSAGRSGPRGRGRSGPRTSGPR